MPYHECPSFDGCSAPKCPLDPEINERTRRYSDEPKCKATKPTRHRIGLKYPELLPFQGFTKREWKGAQMSEDERAVRRVRFLRTVSVQQNAKKPPLKGDLTCGK